MILFEQKRLQWLRAARRQLDTLRFEAPAQIVAPAPPRRANPENSAPRKERDLRLRKCNADWAETGVCVECGRSHEKANRVRLIRPMAHMKPADIRAEWSCFYKHDDPAAAMRLARDLREARK